MNIFDKLLDIQQEIKVDKGRWNEFSSFNYRNCEDILAELKPLLNKHNLGMTFLDEIQQIGDSNYAVSKIRMWIKGENGGVDDIAIGIAREDRGKPKMDSSQQTGSAFSYAHKFALNSLLLLDDNKDPDDDGSGVEFDEAKWRKELDLLDKETGGCVTKYLIKIKYLAKGAKNTSRLEVDKLNTIANKWDVFSTKIYTLSK